MDYSMLISLYCLERFERDLPNLMSWVGIAQLIEDENNA